MNIPNKVVDALSLGVPVLSPLQGEVAKLITDHGVGLRYGTDSGKSLAQCIELLMENPALRQQLSKNALHLYQEKFSFEKVYGGLVKHLEALILKKRPGSDMDKDKLLELYRYDTRAQSQLSAHGETPVARMFGSSAILPYLRTPYIFYEKCVSEFIRHSDQVLELGAGSGLHTWALVQTGARVIATDISPNSLKLLEQRVVNAGAGVETQVADMESLPFADDSFDVVACAGSLSYGDPERVDAEIRRVLRPCGLLVCVDSLNHNPIYRFNRRLHYLRGHRTKSTLQQMPNLARIEALCNDFTNVNLYYFGALSFAMPAVAWLYGPERAQTISDLFDRLICVKRSAFKFVLVAKDLTKGVQLSYSNPA